MTEKCMVAGIDLSGGKTAIQKNFYKNNKAFKVEQKNFYPCLGELINYLMEIIMAVLMLVLIIRCYKN